MLRTIDDFIAEIQFAQEAIATGINTADQEKEFAQFFYEFKDDPEQKISGNFKVYRAERKKVQASQSRQLHPENSHAVRMLAGAIDDTFSGYVHGSYSTIMEMFAGGRDEFDMEGILGSA